MVAEIRSLIAVRPTYGYRQITAMLRRKGPYAVNHKRVYRLMREQGLLLQPHTGRPSRTHQGKVTTLHSNTRWCSDAFGIQCWNGEQLQVAFSLDCCDREVISWATSTRGIDGELVRDLMVESVERRFPGARRVRNGMAEAFVKTFKRDYVYVSNLPSAAHVRAQLHAWFADYNENAPHKGLQMRSPREYLRSQKPAA